MMPTRPLRAMWLTGEDIMAEPVQTIFAVHARTLPRPDETPHMLRTDPVRCSWPSR